LFHGRNKATKFQNKSKPFSRKYLLTDRLKNAKFSPVMKRKQFPSAKAGAMALNWRRAGLNIRANLEPIFRFNDGVFVYRLSPRLRKILNVPEDNPGVAVILE